MSYANALKLSHDPSGRTNFLLRRKLAVSFDDPLYASQWYHTTLKSEKLFELTQGAPEVRVAVIDSAIELSHPEFNDALIAPLDVYDEDDDPSPVPGDFCLEDSDALCDEHGTAVTGVIAAGANNSLGIVGFCADCSMIPVRLIGEYLAQYPQISRPSNMPSNTMLG